MAKKKYKYLLYDDIIENSNSILNNVFFECLNQNDIIKIF